MRWLTATTHLCKELIAMVTDIPLKEAPTNRLSSIIESIFKKTKYWDEIVEMDILASSPHKYAKYGISYSDYYPECDCVEVLLPHSSALVFSHDKDFLTRIEQHSDFILDRYLSANYRRNTLNFIIKESNKVVNIVGCSRLRDEILSTYSTIKYLKEYEPDDKIKLKKHEDKLHFLKRITRLNNEIGDNFHNAVRKVKSKHQRLLLKAMKNVDLFVSMVNVSIESRELKARR